MPKPPVERLSEYWDPEILRTLRGALSAEHYLRVYVGHLRRKIEPNPASPRRLMTEPAIGYRFQTDAASA